ncbi:branched-chain amino acid ABC transporter permease [Pseudorhodoferax sp. Leaf265]|uniref:branched-chain amino acid ABC transporter permease n=1 Tax=Pseudorhodoferax sp. Leaf265 TaxID=1736315 RepID=UPI0006FE026E|nr:branched-chain amino acid ABC transporter permease [Pseudorhodoferax sp. Leaf265]KQP05140.1 ABC transporter permease [Pseudorhodoferax sp. Leaf265]PZP96606.1 MAG: branched-chain amino acid ABC transporter permease [Variovorax paradoxus]PZQ07825.1 MAG: branched-chain amino acid ABC transporter permease [Variovorax paradoxus]
MNTQVSSALPIAPGAVSSAAASRPAASRKTLVWVSLLVLIAIALTFVLKGYQLFQATMVLSYAIALLGLNILTGYNGQISLGHGAFYAIGAYTTGILMEHASMPYFLTVPSAAVVCLVVGYLFGRPALKLEGLYLALATFALGVAMPQLLKYKHLEQWTGGVQGIVLMKPGAPFGLPLTEDQWVYLFSLLVTVIMFVIAHNLLQSGSGRAMRAIRDHAMAAEAMGVDNSHYKAMTFGVSAAFTGVGGALSAIAVQFVAPDSFTLFLSISLLVGIVVGGVGTLYGAIFGAIFIMFVPTFAEKVSKAAPWAVYGVVLIIFMFAMPGGVVGLLRKIQARFGRAG